MMNSLLGDASDDDDDDAAEGAGAGAEGPNLTQGGGKPSQGRKAQDDEHDGGDNADVDSDCGVGAGGGALLPSHVAQPKKAKAAPITLEALQAAGYRGGPSVLLMRRPADEAGPQSWAWCVQWGDWGAASCWLGEGQEMHKPVHRNGGWKCEK
jgi:hypothetical protein